MQNSKVNLLVYLAVWKRPEITELCFLGIQRIKQHPDYNISAFAVISEESMIGLCKKYDIDWVMTDNLPLGKKKNYGLRQLSDYDFDFLLEIGSDDLVMNSLLDQYLPYFELHEFFGISDAAYIESENGECRRLITDKSTYGAGRVISKALLEKMNYSIWNDGLNRGLDNNSVLNIESKTGVKFVKVPVGNEPGIVDIKSNENLWKFNYFLGQPYELDKILANLSEEEVNLLMSLQYVSA